MTGGSSGLGQGIAVAISELGASVIVVGRNRERVAGTVSLLKGVGHVGECFDLREINAISAWLCSLAERHGPLNGVVHSAGILPIKPLRIQTAEDWAAAFTINVSAGAGLAKGFRQRRVCTNGGSVVFLSSVMGEVGQPGQSIYSATKGAINAMTKSMALELAKERIRVNAVAPAVVMAGMSEGLQKSVLPEQFAAITAQHPLGLGTVEDVGNAVAFLLSDASRWITGTTLVVDGGYTAH